MWYLILAAVAVYLPIAGLIFTIQLIVKASSKYGPKLNKSQLKNILENLQKGGFSDLKEVIQYLNSANAPSDIKQGQLRKPIDLSKIAETPMQSKTFDIGQSTTLKPDTLETKATIQTSSNSDSDHNIKTQAKAIIEKIASERMDSASALLYVGAGLVIIGALALVAFNWQNFTDLIKGLLIIVLTLSFYVAGIFTLNNPRVRSVGFSLIAIASVLLALTGVGLWNFGIQTNWPGNFQSYWLIYSLGLAVVYSLTAKFTNRNNYNYFFLAAVYSFIISLSLTLTNDNNFRIVIIAVLNLALYLSQKFFGTLTTTVRYTATILNQLLSLGIILVVYNNIFDIRSNNLQWTAIIAMLIPTIFNLWAHFVEKGKSLGFEGQIALIALCFKLLLVGAIFEFNALNYCISFLAYSAVLIIAKYFVLKPKGDGLDKIASSLIYLQTVGVVFVQIVAFSKITNFDSLNSTTQLIVLTLCWLMLSTTTILDKVPNALQAVNLLLVVIFNRLLLNIKPDADNELLAWGNFAFATIGFGLSYLLNQFKSIWRHIMISPAIFAILISMIISILSDNNWLAIWIFGLSCLAVSIQARFNKLSQVSFIGFVLEIVTLFYAWNLMMHYNLINSENILKFVYLVLVIIILHTILADFEFKNETLRLQNLIAKYTLAGGLIALSLDYQYGVLPLILAVLFIINLYLFIRRRLTGFIYILFGLSIWLNFEMAHNFDFQLWQSLAGHGFLLIIWQLLGSDLVKIGLIDKEKEAIQKLATGSGFILLLVLLNYVSYIPNIYYTLAILFTTASLSIASIKRPLLQYLSGLGLVLMCWNFARVYDLNSQFYVVPVTIYLLIVSYLMYRRKQSNARTLEIIGYNWQLATLLIQSLPSTMEGIYYSLALIGLSVCLFVFGLFRKNKLITYIAFGYLLIGLFIRLYIVLLQIPWYLYLLFIGIGLIIAAIWWTNQRNKKI